MKSIIELEFEFLLKENVLIVNGGKEDPNPLKKQKVGALLTELARVYNISINKGVYKITSEDALEYISYLWEAEKLKTQPFYPNLLPVNPDPEFILNIKKPIKKCKVETRARFVNNLLKTRTNLRKNEADYLAHVVGDDINRTLFKFLFKYGKENHKGIITKISAPRSCRKEFMEKLNTAIRTTIKDSIDFQPLVKNLWKKVALVIHPEEYRKYFFSSRFLFCVNIIKEGPKKPRLKNLMYKSWKEGTDFECFEKYLDRKDITIKEVVNSIKDYELEPRVSKYKRIGKFEIGKENPGQEEKEIVDLIKLQLRDKLVELAKEKSVDKDRYKIPDYFYEVSAAQSLLKTTTLIVEDGSNFIPVSLSFRMEEVKSIMIEDDHNECTFSKIYIDSGKEGSLKGDFKDDFIIVAHKSGCFNNIIKVSVYYDNQISNYAKLKIVNSSSHVVLFLYTKENGTLNFIGESANYFYHGKPNKAELMRLRDLYKYSNPVISLGELAESCYIKDESEKRLRVSQFKKDLGL